MTAEERIEAFKHAFRLHPAGVAVVTAQSDSGPHGLTVSSVSSVGINPLALAFSVASTNGSAAIVLGAPRFVVNLLTDQHADLARSFARSGAPRFTPEQEWAEFESGDPYLPSARVAFLCEPLQVVPVGESSLIVATVVDIHVGERTTSLVYHDRRFSSVDATAPEL